MKDDTTRGEDERLQVYINHENEPENINKLRRARGRSGST